MALLDPVLTRPSWTSVIFEHDGLGEALAGLFDSYWNRGEDEMAASRVAPGKVADAMHAAEAERHRDR